MEVGIKHTLKIGVSALLLGLSGAPIVAQNILSRAQVVGGADACPAIFISFSEPLAFSGSLLLDGGRGLRIRLNRGATSITGAGADLIETYPSLNLPPLGHVGITLNSGNTEPVLVMRFDQAIMAGAEVVQAGDSSIVITGIFAGGGGACGAQASRQDPPAAAITTPWVADLADPVRSIPRAEDRLTFEDEGGNAFSTSVSSYYYLNQGSTVLTEFDTNTSDSDVFDNSLVTSLNMSDTVETEGFLLNWRLNGDYEIDLQGTGNNRLRFSHAYGEFDFTNNNLRLRLGRQTRYDGGVFGRFDGALLTYPIGEKLTAKATAGMPVDSSADGFFASERSILGASIELADIRPGLDASAYFVRQSSGSYTDRQAIGLEAQFQNANTSAFALVDYDLYFDLLNTAKVSGTKVFGNLSSITLSYDISHSPLLSLTSALQGQTEVTLAGLNGLFTLDEMKQLAVDRAAKTQSVTAAYSRPVSDIWMASINGSAFQISATPASGGVAAVASTGLEYYFSAQLVGNSVFSERDVVSVSARYADTASSTLMLVDGYRRFQVSDNIRLNTRVKVGHRSIVSSDGSEWFAIPSINLTYMRTNTLDIEVELGGRLGTLTTPSTTESSSEVFMFAGFSKQF